MIDNDIILAALAFIVIAVELLGILAAVHAVMNARTSQGAIAWAISLVTFPTLALILYAIFGRNKFNGYVSLRSSRDEAIHHFVDRLQIEAVQQKVICHDLTIEENALTRLADLPMTRHNKTALLIDGDETFRSIFDGIASAQNYILVQFFIVKDDGLGRELKDHLIAKAQNNVRVYFLYDEIGSHKLPASYIEEMKAAGIVTSAFHSTQGRTNKFQLNFRNHRKIVIVDGTYAWVGGHNVGDDYRSQHPKFGRWRDTHVKVEGPVVKTIQSTFLEDWHWATRNIPQLNWDLHKAPDGQEKTLLIATGPADPLETCGLMFTQMINSAKERIWIASPYFVPDLQVLSALKLAALRGVDVRILLPEKPDHRSVYLASFSYYQNTIPLGVKLYRYHAGFMHQKVFLVDSYCAAVGTANLDNRSFRLNFELTLINYEPAFIKEVDIMLHEDLINSRRVPISDYTNRSFVFKLLVRFTRLFAPIL